MTTDDRPPAEMASQMDILDDAHRVALERAVTNALGLEIAENTFADILDGLPTRDGLQSAYGLGPRNHPVYLMQHDKACPGYLEKARALRDKFTVSKLPFESWNVLCFQNAAPGTREFSMRLVELVAVACHLIAAFLYETDDSARAHSLQVHRNWYAEMDRLRQIGGPQWRRLNLLPRPVAFSHGSYDKPERYPRGEEDIAGYWAESRIFGGVVLFDRGESERECHAMYLHGERLVPATLYPPTPAQFEALLAFLLSDPAAHDSKTEALRAACPLPIRPRPWNRPRWDPYEALTKFHIFRDKNALEIPAVRYLGCTSIHDGDWPELADFDVSRVLRVKENGEYDPEEIAMAEAARGLVSPTSPILQPKPDWHRNAIRR